jgi:hypothetical protein
MTEIDERSYHAIVNLRNDVLNLTKKANDLLGASNLQPLIRRDVIDGYTCIRCNLFFSTNHL